jgi:hypothetical protein
LGNQALLANALGDTATVERIQRQVANLGNRAIELGCF